MKTLKIGLSLITLVLLFSSCTTTKTITAKRMDIYGSGVIQQPIVAELDIKATKVTGTAKSSSGMIESVKNSAVADALSKSNADVLIEPKFETETTNGVIRATVTGYPGTYVNFRPVTVEDVPLLELGYVKKATVFEPQVKEKRKSNIGAILGSVGGSILLIILILAAMG
jgi:hypothetical protein